MIPVGMLTVECHSPCVSHLTGNRRIIYTIRLARICGFRRLPLHTLPMANAETFYEQPIAGPIVAQLMPTTHAGIATFNQSLIGDEPGSSIFIGEVGPNNIIEKMGFDGGNHRGESRQWLWFASCFESRRANEEPRQMIEVRVGDEDRADNLSDDVDGVGPGRFIRQGKFRKRPLIFQLQRVDDSTKEGTCIDGDHRAGRPIGGCGSDEQRGDPILTGTSSWALGSIRSAIALANPEFTKL